MAELHESIIALVSLSAGIASNHPAMGQCQLAKLRKAGIDEAQIASVIEIARHIRDETAAMLDQAFDEKADAARENIPAQDSEPEAEVSACCSTTASGQSCC